MSLFHLRTSNPAFLAQAFAYKRVARGIRWLDKHAPKYWWLHFFTIYSSGHWHFRAYNSYDNECPLAIAFESDARYANEFGYVTYGSVLNRLHIDAFDSIFRQNGFARSHGFSDDETAMDIALEACKQPRSWKAKRLHIVEGDMLNVAWRDQMQRLHYFRLLAPKHYSKYDRAIDQRMDKVFAELRWRRRSFWGQVRDLGKRVFSAA